MGDRLAKTIHNILSCQPKPLYLLLPCLLTSVWWWLRQYAGTVVPECVWQSESSYLLVLTRALTRKTLVSFFHFFSTSFICEVVRSMWHGAGFRGEKMVRETASSGYSFTVKTFSYRYLTKPRLYFFFEGRCTKRFDLRDFSTQNSQMSLRDQPGTQ